MCANAPTHALHIRATKPKAANFRDRLLDHLSGVLSSTAGRFMILSEIQLFPMKIDKQFSHVLVIGNGFDLNLGLKTSYHDFLKSDNFYLASIYGNSFANYLVSKRELQDWIDIEKELISYSMSDDSKDFQDNFRTISNALSQYLKTIDYRQILKSSKAYSIISEILGQDFLILDFNYTNTVKFILEELGLKKKNMVQ